MSDSLHPQFDTWFREHCPDIPAEGAHAVLALAAEGATTPFIARYRRERTGDLDAPAIRRVLESKDLFDKILARQAIMIESIERHARLTPELRERISAAFDLDQLDDLYHPYRQQKKNRALAAREAGLQQLADWIWDCGHGTQTPEEGQTLELWAFTFRNEEKGIADAKAAIEGARDILVERLAGDTELRALVRKTYFERGAVRATKTETAKPGSKFEPFFAFCEGVKALREPAQAQRYLSLRRGQSEGELQLAVGGAPDDPEFDARLVAAFEERSCTVAESPGAEVLRHAGRIAYKNDVRTAIENEVHRTLKEVADATTARAFAESVRRLLLEPPFGHKPVLGVDPGVRSGCKVAAVDADGKLVASEIVHLQTDEQKGEARERVIALARTARIEAVAVGDGSGGRDTELYLRSALREAGIEVPVVLVSEAGASVYSTSEAARAEFPDLDPTMRGAISIARRLQDPLAELVKVEPRSIGVGQHHHDVSHAALQRALDAAIEACVHEVGVDLNRASVQLLSRVTGCGPVLAPAIVQHREQHGPFRNRRQLEQVPRLASRNFEQAAGFLRVRGGDHPLDDTAVHPERYAALEAFAATQGKALADLRGAGASLVREAAALEQELGPLTRADVAAALENAGRDPRGAFVPFFFRDDVRRLEDLKPGMVCPGIVNNVTSFGAFVDVGVHQDGLVHVSQLGKATSKEPHGHVRPGDRVEVRVLKVDLEKKQISLSMRPAPARAERRPERSRRPARPGDAAQRPRGPRGPGDGRRAPHTDAPARAEASPSKPDHVAVRPARPRTGERGERTPPPRERTAEPRRPSEKSAERRPDARRQAFNNPFAVLADLKVQKRDKS